MTRYAILAAGLFAGIAAAHHPDTPCEPARFLEIAEPHKSILVHYGRGRESSMPALPPGWSVSIPYGAAQFSRLWAALPGSVWVAVESIERVSEHDPEIGLPNEHGIEIRTASGTYIDVGASLGDVIHRARCKHPHPNPAPDLAVRDAQAALLVEFPDVYIHWRATVENIGDATAPATSIRLYYGERELAAQDVRRALAPGDDWPMSHGITRAGLPTVPRAVSQGRICVDPVPGEPESMRANNCTTVTVERN